jgi:hypothetical protein
MGSLIAYPWLPWFRLYPATRRDASLPCQPPALSPGAALRARWFLTDLVCRTHWSLPFLPFAGTVSGEQHHTQAATGECGPVAALLFSRRPLAASRSSQRTTFFCSGTLARLATLQHPANVAESGPQPNGLPGKLLSARATTRKNAC